MQTRTSISQVPDHTGAIDSVLPSKGPPVCQVSSTTALSGSRFSRYTSCNNSWKQLLTCTCLRDWTARSKIWCSTLKPNDKTCLQCWQYTSEWALPCSQAFCLTAVDAKISTMHAILGQDIYSSAFSWNSLGCRQYWTQQTNCMRKNYTGLGEVDYTPLALSALSWLELKQKQRNCGPNCCQGMLT